MKTTQAVQTDNFKVLVGTQTDVSEERTELQEQFVSRINYNIASQEERAPNEEPPTMTRTQPEATQLEANQHEITEGIVATVNQTTITEKRRTQKKCRRSWGSSSSPQLQKDRNLRALINFVKKRDWDAIKSSYRKYWFNVRNRLHMREDCLLIDERIVITT